MEQPESQRVPLGTGLTYHVLRWPGGQQVDHTVVLLHGFLDFAWSWEEVVREGLLGRFHVVAPDLRGHGDSDPVGAGGYYHFLDYLADLHELLDAIIEQAPEKARRLSLVGHSMGGSVAAYYAGSFPERVHRLALLEGTGPPEDPTPLPERVQHWLAGWRRARRTPSRGYQDVAAAAAQLRRHDPLLSEPLALRLAERGTRLDPDGLLRFKHDPLHLTRGPLPYRFEMAHSFFMRVACPVLLVEAEQSMFRHMEEETRRRKECFAHRKEVVLKDAAHMMQRHQPRALAQVLRDFLAETDA